MQPHLFGRPVRSRRVRAFNRADYPPDWELRSRFVREVRSRGRCEWCGAAAGQPHPVTGSVVVLTAAHVGNRDPMAAALLNLAALCQRCHLGHDRPRRPRSRDGWLPGGF